MYEDDKVYALLDFDGYICKAFYAANSKKGSDKNADEILADLVFSAINKTAMFFDVEPDEIEPILIASAHSWKKDVYPQYKAHRKRNDELGEFRKRIIDNDPDIVKVEQLEADEVLIMLQDYIYDLQDNGKVIIFSDDKDLKYYAKNYCKINITEEPEFVGTVSNWTNVYAQMLAGDKEDNITGIPKIGMKTGLKLLEDTLDTPNSISKVISIYKKKNISYNDCLEQLAMIVPVGSSFTNSTMASRMIAEGIFDKDKIDDSLVQVAIERTLEYIRDAVDLVYNKKG